MSLPVGTEKSSVGLKSNPRFRHAYAIIRIDEFLESSTPEERRITVKKIVFDADEADREVERLNRLQEGKGVRYFSQITRLENFDESRVGGDGGHANRITSFLTEPPSPAITEEKLAELESIFVPEFVHFGPPIGLGFPAIRAYEVCANPSSQHRINWKIFRVILYAKHQKGFTDVVGIDESNDFKKLIFAMRAFPDLCKESLDDLTPLEIVERLVDRFGLTVYVGNNHGKFFREEEIHVPKLLVPGVNLAHVISLGNPNIQQGFQSFLLAAQPPFVLIALAFCLDVTEYLSWIKRH
jgi:hypothetical protein